MAAAAKLGTEVSVLGAKIPNTRSLSRLTSKNVPPPSYDSEGERARVIAKMPLSTCTSVRGWEEL